MNSDTGRIYWDKDEAKAARQRGEPIVEVSERVAHAVEIGMEAMNRAERRAAKPRKRGKGYTR